MKRADHVGTYRPDHAVLDISVGTRAGHCVGLGAGLVRIVVSADDVNVRIGALSTGMMLNQMQIAKP